MLSTWTKIDPTRNCFRFYSISLANDLFDDNVVTCEWGRLGDKKLHRKTIVFSSPRDALMYIGLAEEIRAKHHYQMA